MRKFIGVTNGKAESLYLEVEPDKFIGHGCAFALEWVGVNSEKFEETILRYHEEKGNYFINDYAYLEKVYDQVLEVA